MGSDRTQVGTWVSSFEPRWGCELCPVDRCNQECWYPFPRGVGICSWILQSSVSGVTRWWNYHRIGLHLELQEGWWVLSWAMLDQHLWHLALLSCGACVSHHGTSHQWQLLSIIATVNLIIGWSECANDPKCALSRRAYPSSTISEDNTSRQGLLLDNNLYSIDGL